ncbi:hypothetical protein [Streptococcus pyogenes]|uniref:hypothetical protein n=1 Tax=Streptococcus pyogenes TaxID=1314 RepID=UPI0010DD0811|nr:hypothetical protein [Streptococcus pyogenes]VGQ68454.1 Uncharacterised protein [Streptococcus pyogenes]VGR02574.1 Uncharacterised protein [Streptococcus pyogenes]VGR35365.1 Uncharacterised protein [Streptococcus pyogenes]VGR36144.1 Uncharacterised protein [Streptococcus pyogenes]VGS05212.1 Uncharacterised protein [Streptococcus pyogenes]
MNELNLTPTESIILIIVCLVILVLLWRYESYIELDISPQFDEAEENTHRPRKRSLWALYSACR